MYVVLTLTGLRYQSEESAVKRLCGPSDVSSNELKLESDQLEVKLSLTSLTLLIADCYINRYWHRQHRWTCYRRHFREKRAHY